MDAGVGGQVSASPQLNPLYPQDISNHFSKKDMDASALSSPDPKSKYRNPNYVHASMQTDPALDPYDPRFIAKPPPGGYPKIKLMSRMQRVDAFMKPILAREREKRAADDAAEKARVEMLYGATPSADSPVTTMSSLPSSSPVIGSKALADDDSKQIVAAGNSTTSTDPSTGDGSMSIVGTSSNVSDLQFKPPLPPFPSQAAHSRKNYQPPNGVRLGLHISNFPLPGISNPSPVTPGSMTPSAMTPVAQSPFSSAISSGNSYPGLHTPGLGIAAPSPVKKKLSLGDYMNRKHNQAATPATEKSQANALAVIANAQQQYPAVMLKPSESLMEEAKAQGVEDSAVVDTPMKDPSSPEEIKSSPPSTNAPAPSQSPPSSALSLSRDPRLQ